MHDLFSVIIQSCIHIRSCLLHSSSTMIVCRLLPKSDTQETKCQCTNHNHNAHITKSIPPHCHRHLKWRWDLSSHYFGIASCAYDKKLQNAAIISVIFSCAYLCSLARDAVHAYSTIYYALLLYKTSIIVVLYTYICTIMYPLPYTYSMCVTNPSISHHFA